MSLASCPASPKNMAASSATGPSCSTRFPKPPCPKLTVIVRKAYGGAYCVMNPRHIGADLVLAWPSAEIAVMGPEGAVNVIFRRDISSADDPVVRKNQLVEEYRERFANPYIAAAWLYRQCNRAARNPSPADQHVGDAPE